MTAAQRRVLKDEVDARKREPEPRYVPNGLCTYCGSKARKNSLVCAGHADLPKLDPLLRGER